MFAQQQVLRARAAKKAKDERQADYDAKLADKQASDKELAAAKQAEAEAQKKIGRAHV